MKILQFRWLSSFFDPIADMSDDLSTYNKKAIKITVPPTTKSSPIILQLIRPTLKLMTMEQVIGLQLIKLKNKLKVQWCKYSDSKAELKTQIIDAIKKNMLATSADTKQCKSCLCGLPPTTYWYLNEYWVDFWLTKKLRSWQIQSSTQIVSKLHYWCRI